MLVYRGFSHAAPGPTVLTIGNFDGIHQGHRALLGRLTASAASAQLLPAVLTFEPHPREYFAPESAPARLSTLREKLELIADEGVAVTWVFGRLSPAAETDDVAGPQAETAVLRGGEWIGRVERTAVFATVLTGFPEGIAIALALKASDAIPS